MIVYEVAATIREDLCAAYERYMLEKHIADVLATGKFERATFESSEPGRYRTRYLSGDRKTLAAYLEESAPALRDDFNNHFPEGVSLARSEWVVIAELA